MSLPRTTSQDHFPPPRRSSNAAIGGYRQSDEVVKPAASRHWVPTPHREPLMTVSQRFYVAHHARKPQRHLEAPSGLAEQRRLGPPILTGAAARAANAPRDLYETPRSTTAEAYATATTRLLSNAARIPFSRWFHRTLSS